MENRKRRIGDRRDGRMIRTLAPMCYVVPFIMKTRNDACNLFRSRIDVGVIDDYVHQKRREENMPGLGFMHIIVAAYVRMISQRPALNRFVSGQRIYQRGDIVLSMMVKKSMELNAQESAIKVAFSPSDTLYDVYRKMDDAIAIARSAGDTTSLDTVARAITRLPRLFLRFFIWFMEKLDYYGVMPKSIEQASPFHASLYVSNLGSLGIPPVYHHLYNFGNVPVFLTFGAKYYERIIDKNGETVRRKFIDYTAVLDERTTDGHYMASAFKEMEYSINHPESLEQPPEQVVEDID